MLKEDSTILILLLSPHWLDQIFAQHLSAVHTLAISHSTITLPNAGIIVDSVILSVFVDVMHSATDRVIVSADS